jgi:NADPH:quinone reductase-like Zn-dependent oxidoreductase
LAKLNGATVIATAGSNKSKQECLNAGADLVVDHPSIKSNEDILNYTNQRKVDRVVEGDFGLNLEYVLDIIKTGGIITTYSSMTVKEPKIPFIKMMFMNLTIKLVLVYELTQAQKDIAANDIFDALNSNSLKHRIDKTFELRHSAEAQEYIESGTPYGCVVLTI